MGRRDAGLLILFLVALLAVFADAWLPGRTLFARDLTYLFHPMNVWTAEYLQAGRLPLWNPFVSGGVPWLGQPQTGVFSPGNLFFWMFSFTAALKMFHAAAFFLAGLGGYLWARASRASRSQALAAALLWSLNGFWRARAEFLPLLAVLALTPWMGLFLRRRTVLLLGMTGALAVAAGHWPQVLWSAVLVGALGFHRRLLNAWTALPWAGVLSAAALFPGVELALRSSRAAGGLGSAAGMYALTPWKWLGLIWPWAGGAFEAAYTGEKFFWLGCFFLGAAGSLWALLGFARASGRVKAASAALVLAGAFLSLGANAGVYPFLSSVLRPLGWVRFPAQFAFWMTGAGLVLATAVPLSFRRGVGAVLAGAVALELFAYGFRMFPVIEASYFREKPPWISIVQEREGRLFLTPRAASDMRAEGRDVSEAWRSLRAKGQSLITLPYHLRNVNPAGFSLNPDTTERLLSRLYGSPSFEAAAPLLDRLGVRWVASFDALRGKGLAAHGSFPWQLYERETAVLRDSPTWDPGWRAWRNGIPLATRNDDGLLGIGAEETSGVRRLFRPPAFRAGLAVSLTAWAGLILLGGRRLRGATCP